MVSTPLHWHYRRYDGAVHPLNEAQNSVQKSEATSERELPSETALFPGSYWRFVAYCDALVKVRIFIEKNFTFLESLGVLSLTRYIFELSVWARLLERDDRYGLVYYKRLLEANLRFYADLKNHLVREAQLFKRFESKERTLMQDVVARRTDTTPPTDVNDAIRAITDIVDAEVALSFSIYSEQARINGYGFQAHLIEKKAIPSAASAHAAVEAELTAFRKRWRDVLEGIDRGKWNWRTQATLVNMVEEYDFIYSYTATMLFWVAALMCASFFTSISHAVFIGSTSPCRPTLRSTTTRRKACGLTARWTTR